MHEKGVFCGLAVHQLCRMRFFSESSSYVRPLQEQEASVHDDLIDIPDRGEAAVIITVATVIDSPLPLDKVTLK